MAKYIDADKLVAKIKELNLVTKTYEEQVAFNNALAMVVEIITSLQQDKWTNEDEVKIDQIRDAIDEKYDLNHAPQLHYWLEQKTGASKHYWQEQKPEAYFYCTFGGVMPLCSDCKRNHTNSPYKKEDINCWYQPVCGTKQCESYIKREQEPEPKPYDEAYLKECIAKAKKSWEGVDADKFMDEVRGRPPEVDLEKAALNFAEEIGVPVSDTFLSIARHFYELGQKDAANKYDEIEYNRQREEEGTLGKTLDEAAEEYAFNNWEDNDYHTGASEGLHFDAIGHTANCFKAGAEWMQNHIFTERYVNEPFDSVARDVFKDWIPMEVLQVNGGNIPLYNAGALLMMFDAGAKWDAGQGATLKVTEDTTWNEIDNFIHCNMDGNRVIVQIRKK